MTYSDIENAYRLCPNLRGADLCGLCCGSTWLLVRDDDLTIARVHHEDGKQPCRFSGAGILADLMMIARLLRPALTGLICTLGPVVHLAAYRSLEYARIDEG